MIVRYTAHCLPCKDGFLMPYLGTCLWVSVADLLQPHLKTMD